MYDKKQRAKSRPLTCQQIRTEVVVCGVTERIEGASSGAGERSKYTWKWTDVYSSWVFAIYYVVLVTMSYAT